MNYQFGVFRWRADGVYRPQDALKVWKREYEAVTYAELAKPRKLVVKRLNWLGR